MTQYRIIVTPDASDDLYELRSYIADVLCAPDTALSYIRAVRKEIAALSEMPARYRPVDTKAVVLYSKPQARMTCSASWIMGSVVQRNRTLSLAASSFTGRAVISSSSIVG